MMTARRGGVSTGRRPPPKEGERAVEFYCIGIQVLTLAYQTVLSTDSFAIYFLLGKPHFSIFKIRLSRSFLKPLKRRSGKGY